MRGARCEDNTDLKVARARIARSAESFNCDLLPLADPEGKQIQATKTDQFQPDKAEGHAEVYLFGSKPETRRLLEDLKCLRIGRAPSSQQ
jgi:hypothetical protein